MDEKYNTKLSLANIGGEVYLGTDAENSDFELLRGKTQIYYLEIPNNKKIIDDKLQDVLGTLTGLTILVADNSNLASLNFIKSGSILRYLSIYDTSITNLSNLSNCNDLGGIRINTSGVNLKPYSKILSDMCARGYHWNAPLRMGFVPLGGIAAPATIINTLNGTSDNINTNFKCFSCYWGSGSGTLDFTYTSLVSFEDLWNGFTIKVLSCFKRVKGPEVANATIDYTNLVNADLFIAAQVSASNYSGFNGYGSIYTESSNVSDIVGSNTTFVRLGVRTTTGDPKSSPYFNINLSNLISKGTNIETLELYSQKGFTDISNLITLSLNNLTLKTCSLTDLNIPKSTPASNLSTNLTTLTINSSYLQNLEGLSNLTSLTTLDLRNNRLDNTVNVTIDYTNNTKKEIKTCKYIADYCPSIKTVYLDGNADLTDFEDLIKGGFTETATNSRVFTRP